MSWDPEKYNRFKEERLAPVHDLMALINVRPGLKVLDLGCGTGEVTALLKSYLHGANILGIDSSAEMLRESGKIAGDGLKFKNESIESIVNTGEKYDVIFSNAALQWVPGHHTLFTAICKMVNPGGQLLIQMPAQHHNITNRLLEETAAREPFQTLLGKWSRTSPVLATDEYAGIFYQQGCVKLTAIEKIYPLIVQEAEALVEWTEGTALLPYLDRLDPAQQSLFKAAFREVLLAHFGQTPAFYPFRRILLEASF